MSGENRKWVLKCSGKTTRTLRERETESGKKSKDKEEKIHTNVGVSELTRQQSL